MASLLNPLTAEPLGPAQGCIILLHRGLASTCGLCIPITSCLSHKPQPTLSVRSNGTATSYRARPEHRRPLTLRPTRNDVNMYNHNGATGLAQQGLHHPIGRRDNYLHQDRSMYLDRCPRLLPPSGPGKMPLAPSIVVHRRRTYCLHSPAFAVVTQVFGGQESADSVLMAAPVTTIGASDTFGRPASRGINLGISPNPPKG